MAHPTCCAATKTRVATLFYEYKALIMHKNVKCPPKWHKQSKKENKATSSGVCFKCHKWAARGGDGTNWKLFGTWLIAFRPTWLVRLYRIGTHTLSKGAHKRRSNSIFTAEVWKLCMILQSDLTLSIRWLTPNSRPTLWAAKTAD